ncbi:uncharacterized protein CDAR_385421 [Caerostris darwini]|uniref:Sperm microtubule inner protein 1 C-terminal domain-containing protein n=1 Tax=Caerostris darwini TaxID=1538125 RepID=A0AAV4N0A4_9ARAC|nr:uncharacterized protein CDAR_385421 [Caerostris darwini]
MEDLFDPNVYKAWNEALIKEKKIKVKWNQEYGSKLDDESGASEVDEEEEPPCTCKDKEKWLKLSEKKFDWPQTGATGTNTIIRIADTPTCMIGSSPIVKNKLYNGISHDGRGRAEYLKNRYQQDPEEKFHKKVCSNWEYGWNIGKPNKLICKHPDDCKIRDRVFYKSE